LKTAILALQAALFALFVAQPAFAADYYVSPTGSDTANGTTAATAFRSLQRAHTAVMPGDTVHIAGGTYAFTGSGTGGVVFTRSGTANAPIRWFAVEGQTPVFNLSAVTPSGRVTGLDINCSYNHFRGLEVTGVRQFAAGQDSWGVRIRGNNNIVERINSHHHQAPGIFITSGANNLILNCDSHHNFDPLDNPPGGSGDGFGCHSPGDGNVIRGGRGYDNSDDGYDFINADGTCIVEQSFAFRNGWEPDTNPRRAAGNGAGFKSGGYGSPPDPAGDAAIHTVRQCVAFGNRSQGFYANHHNGRIIFYNNTSFNNSTNYDMLADSGFPSDHLLRNNVAFGTGGTITRLTGGNDTSNSWNLGVMAAAADFVSVAEADALAPRQADGSLANNGFARLVMGSDLIDKGVNVMLPFTGTAPDLGAYEFGAPIGGNPGTGGSAGAGGAATAGSPSGGAGSGAGGTSAGAAGSSTVGGSTVGGSSGASQGGSTATGGTAGTGTSGSPTTGGAPGTGGLTGTSGAPALGGSSGSAGSIGEPSDPEGCGCRVIAKPRSSFGSFATFALLGLALAGALRRRRSAF